MYIEDMVMDGNILCVDWMERLPHIAWQKMGMPNETKVCSMGFIYNKGHMYVWRQGLIRVVVAQYRSKKDS